MFTLYLVPLIHLHQQHTLFCVQLGYPGALLSHKTTRISNRIVRMYMIFPQNLK